MWSILLCTIIFIILFITRFRPLPFLPAIIGLKTKNTAVNVVVGFIYGWMLSLLLFVFFNLMYWYFFIPVYVLGLYNAIVYMPQKHDEEMRALISSSNYLRFMNYSSVVAYILQMGLSYLY